MNDSSQIVSPAAPLRSTMRDVPCMREVLKEFIADFPAEVRKLQDCTLRGDHVELRRTVHQLRGACGGYGFDPLSELAAEVEAAFDRPADRAAVGEGVDRLIQMIRSVEGFDTVKH